MYETIEDVERNNKRLLAVLGSKGWVIEVKRHQIRAHPPDWCASLLIFLRNTSHVRRKTYWLARLFYRVITLELEDSVISLLR